LLTHCYSKPERPERVVLLGGSGFIGSHIARSLTEEGIDTYSVRSSDLDLNSQHAREMLVDIIRPTDSIVMLAALRLGRKHDEDAFLANIAMATNLCHVVRVKGCVHMVYISSDSVYPFNPDPICEVTAPLATSLYSLMHIAREWLFSRIEELPVAILRVSQVYGCGDPHNAYGPNRMVRSAVQDGRVSLFGSGEETRDHVHVNDVARLVVGVLARRSQGVLNVATGRSISFSALAQIVKDVCGSTVCIDVEPRKMSIVHRRFDTSRLRTAFPAHAFIPIEEGIGAMVDEVRQCLVVEGIPDKSSRNACLSDQWERDDGISPAPSNLSGARI